MSRQGGTRRSHGAAVGRWQGNPVPGVPPPSPRCPLTPNSPSLAFLLSTLPDHKHASSQMVPLPGSFSLLSCSVFSGCQASRLPRKSPLWSNGPRGSPLTPLPPTRHGGSQALCGWFTLASPSPTPPPGPTELGQDTSSAPRFCTLP